MIKSTEQWFVLAGQQPEVAAPDPKQVAFYIGMQFEELTEKYEAIFGRDTRTSQMLHGIADSFKRGGYDLQVDEALHTGGHAALLDADMDLLWVTVGAARAQGADVAGAYGAVSAANYDKFAGGVRVDPVTRKVLKPEGWQPPNLEPYTHTSLRRSEL